MCEFGKCNANLIIIFKNSKCFVSFYGIALNNVCNYLPMSLFISKFVCNFHYTLYFHTEIHTLFL